MLSIQVRRLMLQGLTRKEAEARIVELTDKTQNEIARNIIICQPFYSKELKSLVSVPEGK